MGEVVRVLHGPEQGLLSDASNGMFFGVNEEKVARAARAVAEKAGKVVDDKVAVLEDVDHPVSPAAAAGQQQS